MASLDDTFFGGKQVQIGICDDSKEERKFLTDKVKMLYPEECVTAYESGQDVLDAAKCPDILLLDIQMPGLDGMETARCLRGMKRDIIIIFVSVTDDYVFQSFDVGAFHYLVKPYSDEKLEQVLGNAVMQFEEINFAHNKTKNEGPCITVKSFGKHITVRASDIVYAEVFDRKVVIHTMDSDIEYYGKMKELERNVGEGFYRPHRAYLVNFNYITKYDSTAIWLKRGKALMSKQNYRDFVKSYLRYNRAKGKE